ncbi:restriction endonuclease subunit S [Flavobacterium sp. FlaQc-57]|uniref:restriction endonuclease subunit S n=1 Tax=Flavobacterium sp. FlaQc-57 TaxID=3374186 RepID=UPI0037580E32
MEKKLPKNWVECILGELAIIQSGGTPSRAVNYYWNGDIPWVKISDIKDMYVNETAEFITEEGLKNSSTRIFPKGTILFTIFATLGKIGILNIDASTNQAIAGIIPSKAINAKFLTYSLIDLSNSISENGKGVAQKNINQAILKATLIPLPPLAEQNRIVAKLDALFTQLETIKTSMEKIPVLLKDFRQQVLTQAVTGKLTESWRKNVKSKSPDEKIIRDTLKKEIEILNKIHLQEGRSKVKANPISFIGKNEINWTVFTIESLCISIVDCLHETAKFSNEGFIVLDTNNIEAFKIKNNKLRYVDPQTYKKWISRLKPKYGDIAFTREGSIGNALMIPENDKYCIGQRTMIFRFSELMNQKYCELYMNSDFFKQQVNPHIKGVASQHVNIRDLRLLSFPIPTMEEQREIVNRVESLFTKADVIEQQYISLKQKIETLPHTILHKAFKGELSKQLDNDGDAMDLLEEIKKLNNISIKTNTKEKITKKKQKSVNKTNLVDEIKKILQEKTNGISYKELITCFYNNSQENLIDDVIQDLLIKNIISQEFNIEQKQMLIKINP